MKQVLKKAYRSEFFGRTWTISQKMGQRLNRRLKPIGNRFHNYRTRGIDININKLSVFFDDFMSEDRQWDYEIMLDNYYRNLFKEFKPVKPKKISKAKNTKK